MADNTFTVEAGHIYLFSTAIGDMNPAFRDADAAAKSEAGGIIAPPTFLMGAALFDPENHLIPKENEPWFGSGKNPTGVPDRPAGSTLHAEQHFHFERPIRAGDKLRWTNREGKKWEKTSRNGGVLQFSETLREFWDEKGELVATVTMVGVFTQPPKKES
jgi:acyl dehydratase